MKQFEARLQLLAKLARGDTMRQIGESWQIGEYPVDMVVARKLVHDGLVSWHGRTAALTELGKQTAERLGNPEQPNRWLLRHGGSNSEPIRINRCESPLGWLLKRRHIDTRQFAAGERLRSDWLIAERPRSITMRWTERTDGGGEATERDPTLSQLAARRRFDQAMAAVGPDLCDVLARVACHGEGLEVAERAMAWPARAGKVVLSIALDRLAAHYRKH
ncbi:MAG: DUF6456 domain-containing protein [Sphingomonadaceae bacterium]|nr:DUF6456 domain-containing protein [Sphingomonadaceae bacterium]